jgi:hypothetical protein
MMNVERIVCHEIVCCERDQKKMKLLQADPAWKAPVIRGGRRDSSFPRLKREQVLE